jgi:hypothetical protein
LAGLCAGGLDHSRCISWRQCRRSSCSEEQFRLNPVGACFFFAMHLQLQLRASMKLSHNIFVEHPLRTAAPQPGRAQLAYPPHPTQHPAPPRQVRHPALSPSPPPHHPHRPLPVRKDPTIRATSLTEPTATFQPVQSCSSQFIAIQIRRQHKTWYRLLRARCKSALIFAEAITFGRGQDFVQVLLGSMTGRAGLKIRLCSRLRAMGGRTLQRL